MGILPILIVWPMILAIILPFLKARRARGILAYIGAGSLMVLAVVFLLGWLFNGGQTQALYVETEAIDHLMTIGELFLMVLIVVLSIRHRKYPVILLSVGQTLLLLWTEFTMPVEGGAHMLVDGLSMLMCAIVAIIGGFICIYAVGYMKTYHEHHKEYKDPLGLFLLDALFVPGRYDGPGVLAEPRLALLLLGNYERRLVFAHRLHAHRGGRAQQLPARCG